MRVGSGRGGGSVLGRGVGRGGMGGRRRIVVGRVFVRVVDVESVGRVVVRVEGRVV